MRRRRPARPSARPTLSASSLRSKNEVTVLKFYQFVSHVFTCCLLLSTLHITLFSFRSAHKRLFVS